MDMSFALMPTKSAPREVVTLDDIQMAALAHRTMQAGAPAPASLLRGQDGEEDPVLALACVFAPACGSMIEAASLAGSFNPSIARQLMVGKRR